jgi:hypothetical protein
MALFLLLFANSVWAAEYFIDISGAGTGSKNGANVSNQCAGMADADCAESGGNTYYICNVGASGTDIDVPAEGSSGSPIVYDFSCPGGTPESLTSGRVVGTGFDYWEVRSATINGSDSGQSAIACFVCETSKGGSCSSREGTCAGFKAVGNTIINAGKHGIEIGTVSNQTSYGQTTGVEITGNRVTNPAAAGISMNANMVSPDEGENTVIGANAGSLNLWGIYTSPRAYNYSNGASWVTAGFTCAGGSLTQYKVTLGGGDLTDIGANEVVTQVIVSGVATGHYATQSAAACNPGSGLGLRRFCQDGSVLHVCGTELNPPTDNDVVIVTSDYGPVTIGRGDNVSGTLNAGGTQDGVGIGSDIGAKNVTIERAYSHENEGRGVEFNMCSTGCVARSNIAQNNGTYGFLANNLANATDVVSWYNNVSFGNGSEPFRISNAASAATQAYNNIAIGTGSQNCVNVAVGGGEGGNHYLNCTATYFPTAITGNPQFNSGVSLDAADDFIPLNSALKRAGTFVGTYQDLNDCAFATPPSIGAFEMECAKRTVFSRTGVNRTPINR